MPTSKAKADEGVFQTTATGYRIPIPNRDDVDRALRKLAAPAVPKPPRKVSVADADGKADSDAGGNAADVHANANGNENSGNGAGNTSAANGSSAA